MRKPGHPSKAEKAAHDALHVNYRSWCRYCVMGRGQHRPHRSKKNKNKKQKKDSNNVKDVEKSVTESDHEEESEAGYPLIGLDYCFLGTHKQPASKTPISILRDDRSKWTMAYCVGRKGPVDWVVDAVIRELSDIGYGNTKVVIKTDQEPAITALRDAIISKRKAETVPKLAVRRDPQSHGETEVAVKLCTGQFRTLKCHIEGETGMFLPIRCDAVSWLAKWAANSLNLFKIQEHGTTAHEAVGGRRCKTPICPFGEHVQWKKQPNGVNSRKAESEWFDGVFLGIRPISGECIVES